VSAADQPQRVTMEYADDLLEAPGSVARHGSGILQILFILSTSPNSCPFVKFVSLALHCSLATHHSS
jgi:hypothetical protein